VDFAGSERMRAYKFSTLMHALVHGLDGEAGEGRAQARALIEEEVRTFEAILLGLRDGSREYGLSAAPTAEIVNQVEAAIQQWRTVAKPSLLAVLATSSVEEARKSLADYDRQITELVGSIDTMVKRLAAYESRGVQYYRRIAYSLLVLLLVVSVGAGYLLHRFVVGPLEELVLATRGMGKGDLSQRVRVMPSALMPDEVRELTAAFNEMTEKLETSFRRVQAVERLSRRILASLPDAVIVLRRGGGVRYANRVFYDWFRGEPSAVVGRSLREVLPLAEAARQIEEIVAGGAHANPFEATWRPEEGEERTFRVSVSGLRVAEEEEEEEEELVILEELTGYRRMAEKQRALEAQLLQAEKLSALGGLVSGVAHELNNPLAVVLGRAELLLLGELDERTRRALETVRTQGNRMRRIIQNLLAVAHKHPPERSWVDLNALLRETVELRVHQMQVNNVEVRWRLDEALPRIFADPHQLGQVFLNLVTNAEHAMAGRPGVLTISTERAGETVRVGVADTGGGIAPEHLPRIFDPFFTTKEVGRGTGLGLSVSYGIVTGHGGWIWAESTLGRGAVFFVRLPLVTEGPDETAEPPPPIRPVIDRDILVVDDEAEVRDVLTELLELDGHRVEAVGTGEEALARLRQRRYDVILTDIRMPGLDGHALYRRLAVEQPELQRRVIFVTGDTVSTETQALLEETRLPHVAKPVTLEALREALAQVCGARGASDSA